MSSNISEDSYFVNASNILQSNITSEIIPYERVTRGHQFPKDMLGFTAACAFTIALLGASGNLLTIFALPMCKKLRTTATAFVVNLAVAELLFCIFILPMSGAQYAYLQYHDESLLSDSDCVFFAVARYTFTQVQLQTIVGIALTRAIAVTFPKLYQKINNSYVIGVYICLLWFYSLMLKLPTGLGIFGSYVFNPKTMECDMAIDAISTFARFISIIVEVFIPVASVLLLYILIFIMILCRSFKRGKRFRTPSFVSGASVKLSTRRVKRASTRSSKSSKGVSTSGISSLASNEPSGEDTGDRKASFSSFKSLKRMVSESSIKTRFTRRSSSISHCINTNRRDMRVARTIFIIFIMTTGLSVPVGYIHFVDSEGKQPRRFLAVHILYWVQYCLNVVVYVLMNRQYRDAYVDCLAKLLPSWERHKGFAFPWETPSINSKPVNGQTSSFRGYKDSNKQELTEVKEPRMESKVTDLMISRQGRLSAIPEVNSSSVASAGNDDVFLDESQGQPYICCTLSDLNDNQCDTAKHGLPALVKVHSVEEKQVWISKNGDTVLIPPGDNEDSI